MTGSSVKRLLIQGATGSIGRSTLAVVREQRERFQLAGLAAKSDWQGLVAIAREFAAESIALEVAAPADDLRAAIAGTAIRRVYTGPDALHEQVADTRFDLLVNAVMGGAGLRTTLAALQRGIPVALANKEPLVAAGPLLMHAARAHNTLLLPIDSEHSALFQCLQGEAADSVRTLWLTASGGPFWGRAWDSLFAVTVAEALAHPTWRMGPKITIDSSTLFNKGLEVIEAQRLFGVAVEQIQVVVHRQSVVHSMVEFVDGSFKAQLSRPDMRLPILYALCYPERVPSDLVRTDFSLPLGLTFEPLSAGTFPCLDLAFAALRMGGTTPAALSAADEVAVAAFLSGELALTGIPQVLERVVGAWQPAEITDVAAVLAADQRARELARDAVIQIRSRVSIPCC